ncbi:flavin reductase family protein [Pelagibacteraceae bacterium]|nr:flavin reductase family protein [Pelagibacteraceae bacterium]
MFYEPKKGHPFQIDPYKALVFPRPIGWISSLSKKGIPNLAPYSYFNAVADEPPQVMFCSNGDSAYGGYKDSLANILSTKEFVVNFATANTRDAMNISSSNYEPNEDEFVAAKLKKRKSKLVKPPSVNDSPVNLECKLLKTLKLKTNTKKISTMVIGEIIGIYINNKFIKNGRIDSVSMRYISRMGYSEYSTISSKFNLKRPK